MPLSTDRIWLTSAEGQRWLDQIDDDGEPVHLLIKRLRKTLTIEQARLIVEQLHLRRRASQRFPCSNDMFFTEKGLEQATDATLAGYKAGRFGDRPVVDLCCGIGGDLMAFAARGPVLGIDQDVTCVHFANASLRNQRAKLPIEFRHTSRTGYAACADVGDISILPTAAIHIDPDRRPHGRRSVQLDFHSPGAEQLRGWTKHKAGMAIKLAPATDVEHPLLHAAELEWIGHRRGCQQLVAWYGQLAETPGSRRATILDQEGTPHSIVSENGDQALPMAEQIGSVIVEPAAPVLAAGLSVEVARRNGLLALTGGGGYLTNLDSEEPQPSVFWNRFLVLESLPFRRGKVQRCLQSLGIGPVEVKTRGVREDAGRLQKQLNRREGESATLFLFKRGAQTMAVVARRILAR